MMPLEPAAVLTASQRPCEDYHYFMEGHLIWCETSVTAIEERRRENTRVQYPINSNVMLRPRTFLFNVDELSLRVYFVVTTETSFDWGSIPHAAGSTE